MSSRGAKLVAMVMKATSNFVNDKVEHGIVSEIPITYHAEPNNATSRNLEDSSQELLPVIQEEYYLLSESEPLQVNLNYTDGLREIENLDLLNDADMLNQCKFYEEQLLQPPVMETQIQTSKQTDVTPVMETQIQTSKHTDVTEHLVGTSDDDDDEDPSNTPENSQQETACDKNIENNDITTKATERSHKNLSTTEKRKLTSYQRLKGKPYTGYQRTKEAVVTHDTVRPGRALKRTCTHKLAKTITKNSLFCSLLTLEDRQLLFKKVWNLSTWNEKKLFVLGLVEKRAIKRRRKKETETLATPRKQEGHDYFLTTKEGKRVKVCRLLFLNTLDLGEDTLKRWVKDVSNTSDIDSLSGSESDSNKELQKHKKRRPSRKTTERENVIKVVQSWLDLIPRVPSHYCRASSTREYVENSFKSKHRMYQVFKEWCRENQKKSAHLKLFKNVLRDSKISIHKPRKDQCDVCYGFKTKNISQEVYDAHVIKKDESRTAKRKMKESANDERLVITVDLQSILTCPKVLASESYYKLKLQVHNFTIYSLKDRKVDLYVWHESTGGVSSNEFTSCLIDYLSHISNNYKTVIIISDGCNYQNRNKTLSSALSDFCHQKNMIVQQLYLEKGHTMMEADSVHSTLEQLFDPPINSPSDYVTRMRMARKIKPYNIKYLEFSFFKKYEVRSNFTSIRPGRKAGDPVVVDIRQLKYLPSGEVFFTLDYSENWQALPSRRQNIDLKSYCTLYKKQLPISDDKYKHLQDLKTVIERDHHPFYDALPHEEKKKKK